MNDQEPDYGSDIQPEELATLQLEACTFTVGNQTFSIPLRYVNEITEISEIFPLPLTPSYVDGLVHLRGSAIPVISIGKIKNIREEQKKVKQLIVLDVGMDKLGIAVNEMPGLSADFSGEVINVEEFFAAYRIE